MTAEIIKAIRTELEAKTDPAGQAQQQRFFKETVKGYGIKAGEVRKISKRYFAQSRQLPKNEIFALCEELWQSGYNEEMVIACDWADFLNQSYVTEDMAAFERWVDLYVSNWAACDTLCNHPVGTLVTMYPALIHNLKSWAQAPNRWKRRAAAVSLIIPARNGLFLPDIFEIADILLTDTDDLVQKGYGWMLKAASEAHVQAVFEFVTARKAQMPRTALRYAIEKMPPELRKQAMAR